MTTRRSAREKLLEAIRGQFALQGCGVRRLTGKLVATEQVRLRRLLREHERELLRAAAADAVLELDIGGGREQVRAAILRAKVRK